MIKLTRSLILVTIYLFISLTGTLHVPVSAAASSKPVVFCDLSWDSIQVENRIAGYIMKHGYDRKPEYMMVESVAAMLGLEKGSIDVHMENWPDHVAEWCAKVKKTGTVVDMGPTFPNAIEGWYVPTYVIKGDPERGIKPMAPDLKNVEDLKKHWELFVDRNISKKGVFYNGPSGWVCHDFNTIKLKTYELTDCFSDFDPGSDSALTASIVSAYRRGKPILFYYWEPTWLMGTLDLTRIEESPFSEKHWGEGTDYGCTPPPSTVMIQANTKFVKDNPALAEFLQKYEMTLKQINKSLAYMYKKKGRPEVGAVWFLKNYPETWHKWVPEDVSHKVDESLKEVKL